MRPTAVIVGGDPAQLTRLREAVEEAGSVELVGEAEGGVEGIRVLDDIGPDITLIHMDLGDSSGLDVVRGSAHDPAVVFLAADDRDALAAFEAGAVDYVIVPFAPERLGEALERAVERAAGRRGREVEGAGVEGARRGSVERIFLRERDGIVPVPLVRISRFEADGDYVIVHVGERSRLVRMRLQDLEAGVGKRFLRVHRSHLVNLDHVRIFEHQEDGRLVVVMDDGARVMASRSRSRELRSLAF